jgi:hypothetical protein
MPPPEGSGVGTSCKGANAPRKRNRDRRETNVEADPEWVVYLFDPSGEAFRPGRSTSDQLGVPEGRILAGEAPCRAVRLLRKEVIQPHLPVRLPCYDFTPIADPTFDGSPPYGLGHRLRVLPTFVV